MYYKNTYEHEHYLVLSSIVFQVKSTLQQVKGSMAKPTEERRLSTRVCESKELKWLTQDLDRQSPALDKKTTEEAESVKSHLSANQRQALCAAQRQGQE